MRKLILALLGLLISVTVFSQSFIGRTEKDIMNVIKEQALKIEKQKEADGFYSITVKFPSNTNQYSFTKDHICYFYVAIETYNFNTYMNCVNYYDERYLRAFDDPCSQVKKSDVWKESKGDVFVYIWIVRNINKSVQFTLYLTQESYEQNKNAYLQKMLSE